MTRTLTEKLALSMLARDGIAAIWQLHLDAAYAHRTGYPTAAAAILELVETAERELMRQERVRVCVDDWQQ